MASNVLSEESVNKFFLKAGASIHNIIATPDKRVICIICSTKAGILFAVSIPDRFILNHGDSVEIIRTLPTKMKIPTPPSRGSWIFWGGSLLFIEPNSYIVDDNLFIRTPIKTEDLELGEMEYIPDLISSEDASVGIWIPRVSLDDFWKTPEDQIKTIESNSLLVSKEQAEEEGKKLKEIGEKLDKIVGQVKQFIEKINSDKRKNDADISIVKDLVKKSKDVESSEISEEIIDLMKTAKSEEIRIRRTTHEFYLNLNTALDLAELSIVS